MKRTATAIWNGGLKDGKGSISTESGVLSSTQYSFTTRFEDGKGTNPEELIAAAHAGCFSMALSAQLGNDGKTAEKIETEAAVTLLKTDAGFTITAVHLTPAELRMMLRSYYEAREWDEHGFVPPPKLAALGIATPNLA